MAATPEPGEPGKGKPFKLLGILDVENTPCARESILHGSLGSVVAGLGHFLLTSRIRRSCDVAVGGFILVTLGCWFLTIYPITVVLYLIIRNILSVQHGSLQ